MKLILDVSKWRCGGSGSQVKVAGDKGIGLGIGNTRLLNQEGYMCCLGQWISQLHPDIKILDVGEPSDLDEPNTFAIKDGENTDFANRAIIINDNERYTVEEKIDGLKQLCTDFKFELEVTNEIRSKDN